MLLAGYSGFTPSVCLSVRPSCRLRTVAWCLFHGLYSYVAQIQPMWGQCVAYHLQVNRSVVKVTRVVRFFAGGAGDILVSHRSTMSSLRYGSLKCKFAHTDHNWIVIVIYLAWSHVLRSLLDISWQRWHALLSLKLINVNPCCRYTWG